MKILDIFIAIGPIFGISTLIGEQRTRRLEDWLLIAGASIWKATRVGAVLTVFYSGLVFVFISLWGFFALLGPLGSVLSWALTVPLLRLQFNVTKFFGNHFCARWQAAFPGSVSPWPFVWFEQSFRPRDAFLLLGMWPLLVPWFLLIVFMLGLLALLFWPLRLAELMRQKLTPEKPHFLNLVAYGLSLAAMVIKLRAILGG
jgi:hypothetical protein